MTKTDYQKVISKLNKKLEKKLELINKMKEAQEKARKTVKQMMTTDPRQRMIDEIAQKYRDEIREEDA